MQLELQELARLVRAELIGDGARPIAGVAPLELAGPEHVSFYSNPRYKKELAACKAGAVIVSRDDAGMVPAGAARLVAAQPYVVFARCSAVFHPEVRPAAGVHPGAHVSAGARIDPSVSIGAGCVVGEGARIGKGTVLHPGVLVRHPAPGGAHRTQPVT
jgi:UDP-3-O-[3-hydroxymyristoyl] glucosamine N-acyltransferase